MSIKLTDTQIVMLSAAAQREDRCLIAHPSLKGGAAQKVATKLIGAGLAKEIKAKPGAPVWRQDEGGGQSYALKLTAAGAKAIPAGDHSASDDSSEDSDKRTQLAKADPEVSQIAAEVPTTNVMRPSAPRADTKLARILELLQRDCGATLKELIAATGWLPHTTRAALTGLRKRRYAVTIDRSDKERGSTYRIRSRRTHRRRTNRVFERRTTKNFSCPNIKESSALGEAASASGGVMAPGRCSDDVGRITLFRRRHGARPRRSMRLSRALPISTPISFVFSGAIIWAGRLPPICRAGCS